MSPHRANAVTVYGYATNVSVLFAAMHYASDKVSSFECQCVEKQKQNMPSLTLTGSANRRSAFM